MFWKYGGVIDWWGVAYGIFASRTLLPFEAYELIVLKTYSFATWMFGASILRMKE
jgi:hypothetical protein